MDSNRHAKDTPHKGDHRIPKIFEVRTYEQMNYEHLAEYEIIRKHLLNISEARDTHVRNAVDSDAIRCHPLLRSGVM